MFTHGELVEIAYRWILKSTPCGIAFKEYRAYTWSGEIPDVIGFGSSGLSVLVECKVSRADFLGDRKKMFRQIPELGMGRQRFYCCPAGLIKKEELPDGWGLIYVNEDRKAIKVHSIYRGNTEIHTTGFEPSMRDERAIMYSALRRLHMRGRLDEIYEELNAKRNEKSEIYNSYVEELQEIKSSNSINHSDNS